MKERSEQLILPAWQDIPDLDLYLDQVLSYVTQAFRAFEPNPETKILTGSMINNYVKHQVMPAPVKKRYRRIHIAYLFMILVMKTTLSLEASGQVIVRALETQVQENEDLHTHMGEVYECFRHCLALAIQHVFTDREVPQPTYDDLHTRTFYWACIAMCARMYTTFLALDPPGDI